MEKDRKLTSMAAYYKTALENIPHSYMWFSIPGGMLTGKPITPEEYIKILINSTEENEKIEDEEKQQRFFHLKDVHLVQGKHHNVFNIAMLDALEVSAWGYFDPSKSTQNINS